MTDGDRFKGFDNNINKILKFPSDIETSKAAWMMFRGGTKDLVRAIVLPTPQNISFSSNLMYQDISLGVIEAGLSDYERLRDDGKSVLGAITGAVGSVRDDVSKASKGDVSLQLALSQQMLKGVGFSNGLLNAAGTIARRELRKQNLAINPNTELYFGNVGLRSFNFQFKLIAKNEQESNTIVDIVTSFEDMSHPEYSDGIGEYVFKYPEEFDIIFYEGVTPNEYLPSIQKCVITSFSHSYNNDTNAFYEGGAPITVDISLTFKEIAVNTKETINRAQGSNGTGGSKRKVIKKRQLRSKDGRYTVSDIPTLVEDKFDEVVDGFNGVVEGLNDIIDNDGGV